MRRNRARLTVVVVATAMLVLGATSCDWVQFRGVASRSGASYDSSIGLDNVGGLVPHWTGATGGPVASSPSVSKNAVYVGSQDDKLYSFDESTGALKWSVTTGGSIESSPAVDTTQVYVGSDDHHLYAIRLSNHTVAWSANIDPSFAGLGTSPALFSGDLYVASARGVVAYTTDGTPLWTTPLTSSGSLSSPAVANGLVFVASYDDGTVWALHADTGAVAWTATAPGTRSSCSATTSTPAVTGGVVYVGLCPAADQRSLFAFDASTGSLDWSTGTTPVSDSPAVVSGVVYAGSSSTNTLAAYDASTGALRWTGALGGAVESSPSFANGVIYVGTDDGHLSAFDAAGTNGCAGTPTTCEPLWTEKTGGAVRSSPTIANSLVFVGSDDGNLYTYGYPTISFGSSVLAGTTSKLPTVARWGPDGRLYVAEEHGQIKAYTIVRNGPNNYAVTNLEAINTVKMIANHNDDGTADTFDASRLVTGMVVTGTAAHPVLYVSSSDPRVGGGSAGTVTNLDTNSGIITRLTMTSPGVWQRLDLVRGLPRSEENHATNAMVLDPTTNTLYVAQGGNTNEGAPSNNFDELPEYAYSAAVLSVNLNAIGNTTYDLPTLTDPNLPNLTGPFGGDMGNRQAMITPSSPVQVYSPGYRNPFSLVLTRAGKLYTVDNGSNSGWGDVPIGAGPGGTCTNAPHEPGTDDDDSLHWISAKGYYGGHPNPTRGNRANTFDPTDPQSPVPTADPVECQVRTSANNGSIAQFPFPTTGMQEYTASDFADQMNGDLLVAGYYGNIYRVHLSPDGKTVQSWSTLFSPAGTHPLDAAVQGDDGAFPGTVWVPDNTNDGTITVFEPADYGGAQVPPCQGTYSTTLDEDHDGYTNADEIDNGTDPCSAASKPHDWNQNGISDLHDPDDDSDGLADTVDPFAIDPNNGLTTDIPITYSYQDGLLNQPCAPTPFPSGCPGGLLGVGFTGLMTNGVSNYASLFDESNMTVGGAAGVLTISEVPPGDALGSQNTQQYGLQFGVDANPLVTGVFTAHTRILAPFAGITPAGNESLGLYIGTGDQDNYLKLVATANGGSPGMQVVDEVGGVDTFVPVSPLALPGPDFIDLYLTVDPNADTVQARYQATTNGVSGPLVTIGSPISIPSSWLTNPTDGLAIGLISTSSGGSPFAATWSVLEATDGAPS
jgi:outer membrane protein assembly factor BamB